MWLYQQLTLFYRFGVSAYLLQDACVALFLFFLLLPFYLVIHLVEIYLAYNIVQI